MKNFRGLRFFIYAFLYNEVHSWTCVYYLIYINTSGRTYGTPSGY